MENCRNRGNEIAPGALRPAQNLIFCCFGWFCSGTNGRIHPLIFWWSCSGAPTIYGSAYLLGYR